MSLSKHFLKGTLEFLNPVGDLPKPTSSYHPTLKRLKVNRYLSTSGAENPALDDLDTLDTVGEDLDQARAKIEATREALQVGPVSALPSGVQQAPAVGSQMPRSSTAIRSMASHVRGSRPRSSGAQPNIGNITSVRTR
jgi:hypothetical protein